MDCNVDPRAPSLFESQPPNPTKERYERSCQTHGFTLASKLLHFQEGDTLCDVTIIVDGKSFHAHKVVLAATSGYFESMFTSGFKESSQSEVKIQGNSYAFGKLLEFAYSGDVKLSWENVIEVLKLACYMQFTKAVKLCGKFLIGMLNAKKVTYEDTFLIAMFAEPHGKYLQDLHYFALKVLALGFFKFMKSRTFLKEATAEFLEKFLEKPSLARSTPERKLLNGVINWMLHDWENRKQHAAMLLKTLRLGVIPLEKVRKARDFVQKHNLTECMEILDHVVELQSNNVKPSYTLPVSTEQKWFTPRNMITAPFAIGGIDKNNTIQYFEPSEQKWLIPRTFPRLKTRETFDQASVVVDGVLYVAGGSHGFVDSDDEDLPQFGPQPKSILTSKFWKYDSTSNTWKSLASMQMPRGETSLVHIDGNIYAVGGETTYSYSLAQVVECYSITDDEWKYVAAMSSPYKAPSAVVLNGKILVYGRNVDSYGRWQESYNLEIYDPGVNKWKRVASEKYKAPCFRNSILTVQDGVCYRVSYKLGKEECSIGDSGKPQINRIDVRECRNGRLAAVIGKAEDQVPFIFKHAFCMNGKVFVFISEKYVYNTGIDAAEAKPDLFDENKWKWQLLASNESVVTFTVDILNLHRTQRTDQRSVTLS